MCFPLQTTPLSEGHSSGDCSSHSAWRRCSGIGLRAFTTITAFSGDSQLNACRLTLVSVARMQKEGLRGNQVVHEVASCIRPKMCVPD